METNALTGEIVDAAMKVHSAIGPGLLEHAYEVFLATELRRRALEVKTQVPVPITYEGERVELGYRIDLLVEDAVIVEVKAVATIAEIHRAQLLSYLRLAGLRYGLLLNFHTARLRDGIVRIANGW